MTNICSVSLREVMDCDLAIFFEHQRDPEATRTANFLSRDHDAFFAHWRKIRTNSANIIKTILQDGKVAGNVVCWPAENKHLIGYWIGREFWNRGIATAALSQFLKEVGHRPLHAYVARQNVGSIRVLEKCGFTHRKEDPAASQDNAADDLLYAIT